MILNDDQDMGMTKTTTRDDSTLSADDLLGATAMLLLKDRHETVAQLLTSVKRANASLSDSLGNLLGRRMFGDDYRGDGYTVNLFVPFEMLGAFDFKVLRLIQKTMNSVWNPRNAYVDDVRVVPSGAPPDWKSQVKASKRPDASRPRSQQHEGVQREMNPFEDWEAKLNETAESDLGTVVAVLDAEGRYGDGDLLELARLHWEAIRDNWTPQQVNAVLEVPPAYWTSFGPELEEIITQVLCKLHNAGERITFCNLRFVPLRAEPGWRTARFTDREKGTGGENQGIAGRGRWVVHDRLRMLKDEEPLYFALVRKQAELPPGETIGIMPGSGYRAKGHTFWPDFVIAYKGKTAGIEVDGPHHRGRASDDHGRDRQLVCCGLQFIERISVEDTNNPHEVEEFITRFVGRLARQ